MRARQITMRLLQLLAAAAVLIPILVFGIGSWIAYRQMQALADERIERSLDVMQEQALKVFQSMALAIDDIDRLLGHRGASEISAAEPVLHTQLRQIESDLPDVQSLWVFGPDGLPLVITRESPPPALSYAGEDYFTVPRDHPDIAYVGGIHRSVSGGEAYFTFDRAFRDADGKFSGVIEMSLRPSHFASFYSQLASGPGAGFSLLRDDGTILARFPAIEDPYPVSKNSAFRAAIAANSAGGLYDTVSQFDHTRHRVGYRRLAGLPLYVRSFVVVDQVRNEWLAGMATHLIFGLPATILMFILVLAVLRRTKRLYAEIDQRHLAEQSLRQAQRLDAIGHLTGGVAHDFNNLLTIILGNLDAAKRQLDGSTELVRSKLSQRIDNALHGTARAATLTKRLLAFARQTPLKPEALNVNRLLAGLSEFLQRSLGEDVALEIVGAAGLWDVEVDAAELEAAILNLAVNARDAMQGGGKMTIETANSYIDESYCRQHDDLRPGQYVLISVTDTGTGMSKEIVGRAFEPFFTTKESGQGTGLGLSQVYGFVKQSGGHVKIYSEIDEGTTVKLYLPRASGQARPVDETREIVKPGRPGECVLVVEDDDDVRNYVVETLGEIGYDVLEASGADEALRLVDQYKKVSLLLTDVVMPGKNGRILADEIANRNPAIKVLFMTGYSRNAIVHQGRLDAGVAVIQKPLTSNQLADAVRKVLDQ